MAHHGAECEECKYFVHARRDNGRIDRKHYGTCAYRVIWPAKVPMTYSETYRNPTPHMRVWANSNAEGCACFESSKPRPE